MKAFPPFATHYFSHLWVSAQIPPSGAHVPPGDACDMMNNSGFYPETTWQHSSPPGDAISMIHFLCFDGVGAMLIL